MKSFGVLAASTSIGPLAFDRLELGLVVVIARAQPHRTQRLHRLRQALAQRLPAVEPFHAPRAGHHHVLGPDRLIEIDRLLNSFGLQSSSRRCASSGTCMPGIVQGLADVLGELRRPLVVRSIELDHLVAHLADGA